MARVVQPQLPCPYPGQVREHKFCKKHKGGYIHIVPPSTCSLDQIAECFCADSGRQVASAMAENAKKSFRIKELAQWVAERLPPCRTAPHRTAQPADAQDRIKELEKQLAQQRKRGPAEAEIGAEPIESSQPSEPSQPESQPALSSEASSFLSPALRRPSKAKGRGSTSLEGGSCFPRRSSHVD